MPHVDVVVAKQPYSHQRKGVLLILWKQWIALRGRVWIPRDIKMHPLYQSKPAVVMVTTKTDGTQMRGEPFNYYA